MATVTIPGLTDATAGNITGAAKIEAVDSNGLSVDVTLAVLRTRMLAGSTGFTAADPLLAGVGTFSGGLVSTQTSGVLLNAVSATTGQLYVNLANTSGLVRTGLDDSTGAFSGIPYSAFLSSVNARSVVLLAANNPYLAISGGDITNSSAGNFKIFNSTAPTGNPTGGGFFFSEAGAGKWRGTSGTVTTFGPAEPHCPACGRDFMTEHQNDKYGRLAVCLACLADEIGARPWIIWEKRAA